MPVVTQKIKVSELPASATLNATQWLYVEDEAFAAISQRSRRISPLAWDTRYLQIANNLSDVADVLTAQINLSLQPGVDVQVYDAFLTSIATLGTAANKMLYTTGVDVAAEADLTAYARTLLDDANAATARTTLGLGSMAVINDAPSDGNQYARQNAAWAVVSGGVTSVFGRVGVVVAVAGDYTASLITNVPAGNIAAVTAQAAIDELDTEKAGLALANVFTAAQTINVNSVTALVVEQDGVKDNVLVVNTATGRIGFGTATPSEEFELEVDQNGLTRFLIDNNTAGTSAGSELVTQNDLNKVMQFGIWSSSTTAYGAIASGESLAYTNATGFTFMVENGTGIIKFATGGSAERARLTAAGNLVIGNTVAAAKLHVDQASTTAAIPVLTLDQADVSEEFIRFIGTSAADASQSLVDAVDMTTPGALVGWKKIYIQDDAVAGAIPDGYYFVPFYAAPTA